MVLRFVRRAAGKLALPGLAWLTLTVPVAQAQYPRCCPPPVQYPTPAPLPGSPLTPTPTTPSPTTPSPSTPSPSTPQTQTPNNPQPQTSPTNTPDTSSTNQEPSLGGEQGSGGESGGVALAGPGGYLDNPIPISTFRLRYDAAFDDNRPDRADFFYPKCGCFRAAGIDPNAPGPGTQAARKVDYQDLSAYLEVASDYRYSAFVEVPYRWVDIAFANGSGPVNPNTYYNGLSDVNFGGKFALIACPNMYLTAQLKLYTPSGDAGRGLGTNNWNLEPNLLGYFRPTENVIIQTQTGIWVPLSSQDDFAGDVLEYGVGVSYLLYNRPNFRILPVVEFMGWTCLSGKELTADGNVLSAKGDTIINGKFGVRFGFGQLAGAGLLSRSDLYVGYGHALTGDVWYKDIARVEYRFFW